MKKTMLVLLLAAIALSLTACSSGPSNKDAKEAIYGVTLHEGIKIVERKKCDLAPDIPPEQYPNPWLIRYRTQKGGDKVSETLLYETEEGWRMGVGMSARSACQ